MGAYTVYKTIHCMACSSVPLSAVCHFYLFYFYHTLASPLIIHLYPPALTSTALLLSPHGWAIPPPPGASLKSNQCFSESLCILPVSLLLETQLSQPLRTCISVVNDRLSSAQTQKVAREKLTWEGSEEPEELMGMATFRKAHCAGLGF